MSSVDIIVMANATITTIENHARWIGVRKRVSRRLGQISTRVSSYNNQSWDKLKHFRVTHNLVFSSRLFSFFFLFFCSLRTSFYATLQNSRSRDLVKEIILRVQRTLDDARREILKSGPAEFPHSARGIFSTSVLSRWDFFLETAESERWMANRDTIN